VFEFDTKDYRSIVLKAAAYKPDLIIVAGFAVHIYPLLGALRTYRLLNDKNVVCTMDFIDLMHNGTSKSELTNVPFIAPWYEVFGANNSNNSWAKRYKERYRAEPSYVSAYAYEAGRIVVSAYKKFGKLDTASIRGVLPVKGMCGEIAIDQDGDLKAPLSVAELMPDGTIKQIGAKP